MCGHFLHKTYFLTCFSEVERRKPDLARVEILGTCGCIYIGRKDENGMTVVSSDMKQRTAFVNSWRFLFKDAYLAEDTAFIRCILENGEPQIDGRDGKMAVRVVNAGNRSIREKKIIALC